LHTTSRTNCKNLNKTAENKRINKIYLYAQKNNLDNFEEEQQKQMNGTSNENRSEQPKSRRNRTAKMNEKRNHRDYFTGISTDVLVCIFISIFSVSQKKTFYFF
jgi:hypothetical protein